MKIIVEVDEYKIESCKRHVKERYGSWYDEVIAKGTPLNTLKSELLKHSFTRKAEEGNIFVEEYYMIEKSEFDKIFDKAGDTDGKSD